MSKVGLGNVGVVESLGKAEPALLEDLGKICSNEMRWVNTYNDKELVKSERLSSC